MFHSYAVWFSGSSTGVFTSSDGGAHWSAINTGLPSYIPSITVLMIDPTIPTTLYAGTFSVGLFKSSDGGAHWSGSNDGLSGGGNVFALAIDAVTPTTLYAGTGSGVFKSSDGGDHWDAINAGLPNVSVFALAIDPVSPTTLYAASWGSGVFKSNDGGAHWNAINTGLSNTYIAALAIDPVVPTTLYAGTNGDGVFKSSDGGDHWDAINTDLFTTSVTVLAIDPVTPTTLYAGTRGGGVFELDQVFPDLAVTKLDAPDPVTVNKSLTYTITVTNNGPGEATGVTVAGTLLSGVTFVSATPSQGSCSGTSSISCNLGTLAEDASATITVVVTPTAAGSVSNTATVSATEPDSNSDNNTSTAVTTVDPDDDNDSYSPREGDCDDHNAAVHPGAPEVCGDGIDQDCNGADAVCPPPPPLAVLAPNGGETWPLGSTQTIQWNPSGMSGKVKIELSRDNGATWTVLFNKTPNDGTENWIVTGPTTGQARVRVSSVSTPGITDSSNAVFTISSAGSSVTVLAPNGGETWTIGSKRTIQWSSSGLSGTVKIELSRDGGGTWAVLSNNVKNTGSLTWKVAKPATTQARIRVSGVSDPSAVDTSNANFTIQ